MLQSTSDITILIFGLTAIVTGLLGLTSPEIMLHLMNFSVIDRSTRQDGDYTLAFLTCSSVASLNMGVYYLVAVWTQWIKFYQFTVIFRLVTVTVLMLAVKNGHAPTGLVGVVIWELIGALTTAAALWHDAKNRRRNEMKKTS
ncbi:unnamed protein product [Adineta ricciae]|uniref:Uncharacterized protein n=1 Tax=Adineta ricciae TaxID=249248 RepID=A0A815E067_ADIRI|nr:unnamed protein product [Adineta ricciae]CAF1529215.1 unnamed protein product [Adineta ricciae]